MDAWLRKTNGTLTQVSASNADDQTVQVASGTAIAVGDEIEFRADSAGKTLVYLEHPTAVAAPPTGYGIKSAPIDVSDVPATNNLVKNPVMRTWPGLATDPPPNWAKVGTPTLDRQTAAPFTAIGGQSIKVTSSTDGHGVVSDAVPIFPTAENPHVSGYARIWVASGSVRVELVFTTPQGTKVMPVFPEVANNSVLGQWADLGVKGIDAKLLGGGATAVAIRVVQNGATGSVYYVDAAQVTESPSQEPFFEGSGGTRLWQEANEALRKRNAPLARYQVSLADLEAIDPATWDDAALIIGADARVKDAALGIDIQTRIIEVERDYLNPGDSRVVLSNAFEDLTDLLSGAGRASPMTDVTPTTPPIAERPVLTGVDLTVKQDGNVVAVLTGDIGTQSFKFSASKVSMPTDSTVETSGTVVNTGRSATIDPVGITLAMGERLYIRAIPYTGASATLNRGISMTGEVDRQNRSVTKTRRFLTFVPRENTPNWLIAGAAAHLSNSLSSGTIWFGAVIEGVPVGATITAWRARLHRVSTLDTAEAKIYRVTETPPPTLLSTLTHAATTGWVTYSGALSEVVGADRYTVEVQLVYASSPSNKPAITWVEVDFTVPDMSNQ